MSQHPILRKSLQLFNSHFSLLLFYGTSLLFLIFKILSRLKKRVGHLKVGSPSLPSPSRVQIGGLHTPSSRPRDQIPPNLISESLLPVPQPAFQLPEAAKSKILMALTHLALNGMDTETPRGPSEAQAPLSARQLNVTRWWCARGITHGRLCGQAARCCSLRAGARGTRRPWEAASLGRRGQASPSGSPRSHRRPTRERPRARARPGRGSGLRAGKARGRGRA